MENEFYRDYKERVMPALQKQHRYKNVHQVPKVEKVVINTSVGSQSDVKQALEEAKAELALITGQRPENHDGRSTIRYDYRVPLDTSGWVLRRAMNPIRVGYRGLFRVDANSLDVVEVLK